MRSCGLLASIAMLAGCGDTRVPAQPEPVQQAERIAPSPAPGTTPDATGAAATPIAVVSPDAGVEQRPTVMSVARSTMRCTLRVSRRGIYVDGDPVSHAEAITRCRRRAGAMVVLEDDAPADEWKTLQAELRREGVPILMRGVLEHRECVDNPLAKGCT